MYAILFRLSATERLFFLLVRINAFSAVSDGLQTNLKLCNGGHKKAVGENVGECW